MDEAPAMRTMDAFRVLNWQMLDPGGWSAMLSAPTDGAPMLAYAAARDALPALRGK
jgi:hypothetical protein